MPDNMMKTGCGAFEQEFFGTAVKGDQGGDAGDGAGCRRSRADPDHQQ